MGSRTIVRGLLMGMLVIAGAAQGQTLRNRAAAAEVDPVKPDGTVEIIITARKRAENPLDVPASITVLDGHQLAEAGIQSVADLQNSVPNLQYTQRGDLSNAITIRGIGGDPRNIGVESGVGLYVDQSFVGRTGAYNFDLIDIKQIEVLRGPQGTIFGKNTTGGVINITTARPDDRPRGTLDISYGNYGSLTFRAGVSGPVSGNLFVGLSLATTNRDGLVRNLFDKRDFNGINRRGGKVHAVWKPTDGLEVFWTADRTTNRTQTVLGQPAAPFTGIASAFSAVNSRFTIDNDQSNRIDLITTGGAQTVDLDLGGPSLTSISGYRETNVLVYTDGDALPVDVLHGGPFTDNSKLFTEEVRLSSPSATRLRYVGGIYFLYQHATSYRELYLGGSLSNGYVTDATINTASFASYADIDFDLGAGLTLSGGLRYTRERKSGSYRQIARGKNYDFEGLSRLDGDLSWSASARYRLATRTMVYATVSRGFKSGGYNVDPITAPGESAANLEFAPERVTNYELGVKAEVMGGALTVDAAAFHDNFTNKQVSQFLGGSTIPTAIVSNAAAVRIEGFEIQAGLRAWKLITIKASASHLRAKYTSFNNAAFVNGVFVSYTGNRLENAPAWSGQLQIEGKQPVRGGFLTGRMNLRYTGATFFQPDNAGINLQSGYALIDARLELENKRKNLTVGIWVKNLGNKNYLVFSRESLGTHQVLYGDPRTFGIEIVKHL